MDLISIEHKHGKAFNIEVRGHEILADMKKDDGGQDEGMNPTDLFAASLGACIGMIIFEYCKNHDLPADGISVSVVPQLADNPKRIQSIAIDVSMPDGFPEDRIKAVQNCCKHCVIHNTLENKPEIDIEID